MHFVMLDVLLHLFCDLRRAFACTLRPDMWFCMHFATSGVLSHTFCDPMRGFTCMTYSTSYKCRDSAQP